jgi:DNA-binding CsgD family transcriptional regulator
MAASEFPPLPFPEEKWLRIVKRLKLSPQQTCIGALILKDLCEKQMGSVLGISVPTIRGHKKSMFHKCGVSDTKEFILMVFRLSHDPHS